MTDEPDFEELEQIPWSALAAKPADPRARYGAIGLTILLVAGALVWLALRDGSAAASLPLTTVPTASAESSLSALDVAPQEVAAPTTLAVYTEADLMLIDVDREARLAAMHAAWLVRDYLTVDGEAVVSDRIAELLPDADRGTMATYVEWVEVYGVDSPAPGEYEVSVVFRLLVDSDEGYVREPAGAVTVALAVDVDGSATLLTAPEPTAVPTLTGISD